MHQLRYQSEPVQLIHTKLYPPQAKADLIDRPHLLACLDAGLAHKLMLVSAPPGYGKTTLASQWLAHCGYPAAWLALDDGDNHIAQFLRYVCAAVHCCIPEGCATLSNVLTAAKLPDREYLAELLVAELNALPTDLILVFDDYHRIRAAEVHEIMRHLLRYKPARLRLMILTRSDPPLALGRLRLEQQISEIRAADLRFGLAETRRFLHGQIGCPLDNQLVRSLQQRAEGWVIGLQLAGIILQRHSPAQSPAQLSDHIAGNHRVLVGYLGEEVMAGLPEEVAEFLTRTALVDRFCAPLGDALLAGSSWPDSSQATIARIEALNLFIIPLDDEGIWFRYHDLFRDFLLHRLKNKQKQDGLARLHQQAGDWLAQAGLIEDALRHTLTAGDKTSAADLVETNLHSLLDQKVPAPVLVRWLDLFPEAFVQTHAGLLSAQLFLFVFRWDMAAVAAALDRAYTLAETDSAVSVERRQLRLATLDTIHGCLLYWQGAAGRDIMPVLERALEILHDPTDYLFVHAQSTLFMALASVGSGQGEAGLALLQSALDEATAYHRPTMLIFLGGRSLIQLYAAALNETSATAEAMLALVEAHQTHPAWSGAGLVEVYCGWAHYFLASAYYEQNDLEVAAHHWRQLEAMRYQVNPGVYHDSLLGLALVAQAQGQAVTALAYAQAAREFAVELRSPARLAFSEGLEIRLALLGGNLGEATRRAPLLNTALNQGSLFWLEPPGFTALKVMLAEAKPAGLTTAVALAETYLRQAEEAHNSRQVIQITALQALIYRAQGRTAAAFEAFDRALTLAEPNNLTRMFLDLGAPMAAFLQQLELGLVSSAYVKHLLAAFAHESDLPDRSDQTAHYVQRYGITPLTPRELELLALVAQRWTTKEMAEHLVISANTVKRHLSNLYTKLGVHNRRQAVTRAREVGLLPPK